MVRIGCFLMVLGLALSTQLVLAQRVLEPLTPPRTGTLTADWCVYHGQSFWEDPDPDQNALARITLILTCDADVVMAVRVKAETRCGRALCTWSYAEEASLDGQAIEAVFFTFSATRSMRLQLSGTAISVEVVNSYNQEGREPDTMRARLLASN